MDFLVIIDLLFSVLHHTNQLIQHSRINWKCNKSKMDGGGSTSKRTVPANLRSLLEWDRKVTKIAFDAFDKRFGYQKYHNQMKWLENSCHGIFWLVLTFAMLYFGSWPGGLVLWMNLLVYLIIDIIFVAVTKAFSRRRRPTLKNNDDIWFTKVDPTGVDKFSFPSGHASRAIGLALFFAFLYPLHIVISGPIFVWAVGVVVSRVLLGRHHILDVTAGVALAFIEYLVMHLIWLSQEQAERLSSYLGGEDPWSGA